MRRQANHRLCGRAVRAAAMLSATATATSGAARWVSAPTARARVFLRTRGPHAPPMGDSAQFGAAGTETRRAPRAVLVLATAWLLLVPAGAPPAAAAVPAPDPAAIPAPPAPEGVHAVTVTALAPGAHDSLHGYVEYRFQVHNRSAERAHRVRVSLPAESRGYGAVLGVSRSAVVGPGSTVVLSLLQPPVMMGGYSAEVRVDGARARGAEVDIPDHGPGAYYPHADDQIRVLTSHGAKQAVADLEADDAIGATMAREPAAAWSPNWLSYTRYDGLIVTGAEAVAMPPPVRTALEQYVEAGGVVLVLGPERAPAGFLGLDEPGAGHVGRVFGQCLTARDWNESGVRSAFDRAIRLTAKPFQQVATVAEAHTHFPVVQNLSIPVRGMLLLMFGFVAVIGPVNLILLYRLRRRLLLFVTTPAVSLLTCGLVFTYALFSEGISARYRLMSLTVLDEPHRRATTVGWLAFYSPLTPRGGLRFSYYTELSPQFGWGDPYTVRSEGRALNVDWTECQHLTGGWIRPRIPLHFRLRKSEPRRERLKVRRDASGLTVVNGLGADIRRLTLADHDGRLYVGTDIAAGSEAALEPQGIQAGGGPLRAFFQGDWEDMIPALAGNPTRFLRPGAYVADLDGNPFVEHGLADAVPTNCLTVVYGILESGDRED